MALLEPDRGIYAKYRVISVETGKEVEGCFVLRPQKDKVARLALHTYAKYCGNSLLKKDILEWINDIDSYTCLYPYRKACEALGEYICCAHCFYSSKCIEEDSYRMCGLVSSEEVVSVEQCRSESRWEEL